MDIDFEAFIPTNCEIANILVRHPKIPVIPPSQSLSLRL
jgi:hypothetical protein